MAEDWRTFECPECGDVEDIDVAAAAASGVTEFPCACGCAALQLIDEE